MHLAFPSMNPWYCLIFNSLCFYLLYNNSVTCESNNYSLDHVILDCGSAESASFNGRYWIGDVGSKFLPADYKRRTVSTASTTLLHDVPKTPYSTARVFYLDFAYDFPSSPGFKFIRLHFYPDNYSRTQEAYFSVVCGRYTLLSNFSPSAVANSLKVSFFIKDFVVKLKDNLLNISFIPSPESYGFVNGIEIYNLVPNFYNYSGEEAAFEMAHRVQMGQDFPDSLWKWADDSRYVSGSMSGTPIYTNEITQDTWKNMSNYAAPYNLYSSAKTMGSDDAINMEYNLTWSFPVDPGFKYLVRLHFCEISYEVTQINQRVFTIYINNQTAEKSLDVIALAGARFVAVFRDYIVPIPKNTSAQELHLALHPNTDSNPLYKNAILNGVEIIKLSDAHNNLAAEFQMQRKFGKRKIPLTAIIVGGLGGIFISSLIVYFVISNFYSKPHVKMEIVHTSHQFKLADIRAATHNFSEDMVVGMGGFGKVYKGFMDGGETQVAIKRKHVESNQGFHEFQTELQLLSTFRHTNLVSLLGFCHEKNELILVYEYMSRGTLRDLLYKRNHSSLSWIQRLKICIGATRGLHYLHTGTNHSIIHRDVKSSNILLDGEWGAKVSDFGLSRMGPSSDSRSHVDTEVKGTFGYLDPVYYRNRTLSKKSDVYSFGVVLLEVLCARPAVNYNAATQDAEDVVVSLVEWALRCHQNGDIDCIVDPFLRGKIAPQSLRIFTDIAIKCLAEKRTQRPTMDDVLHNLEWALHLQEVADHSSIGYDGN